jgi:imidazole glycerol phosphate synthase subunit HisF
VSDGPFHTIVLPGELPVRVTEVTEQVSDPLAVPLTVGGVVLSITITDVVLVQPAGLVAVHV